jgi:hypothetical protein
MGNADKAAATFRDGFSCSQAVLGTYCERFGLDKTLAHKISTGFGGGIDLFVRATGRKKGTPPASKPWAGNSPNPRITWGVPPLSRLHSFPNLTLGFLSATVY